jgi:lipopolysaccharide/colanic/teichoic acid biosynthesis glycosyltransferase
MPAIKPKLIIARQPRFVFLPAARAQPPDIPRPTAYFRWKTVIDRVVAVLLLAPGLPLIALLTLLVRLTSRGPGIFRQVRVGRDGRNYMMYKIRTMRLDAEAASGPIWAGTAGDPRITPLGRVLRKFHLDELPQLLNVVKGEMSLVGPRPERPEFVRVLAESIPDYRHRLLVPPGITGLAQLNLPPDSDLNSVRRKLILDCEYINRAGPWLDARLVLCTFLRIFKLPERWLLPLFGLRRIVSLPVIFDGPGRLGDGNGNGNGNGAQHHFATPEEILLQAAAESVDGDGDGNGDGNGSGGPRHKDADDRAFPHKPR